MADNGAWQSGVFDNGSGFQNSAAHDKAAAPAGGESRFPVPGVPAAMYNPPATIGGSKDAAYLPIVSVVLRAASILFTVIGFAIIASNSWYGLTAIDVSDMAYLLSADVIVCAYSIVQLVLSIVNLSCGKPVLSGATTPASTVTFICDQVLTYMLMAACGAGASYAHRIKIVTELVSCVYCNKVAASVAMSFFAFVCIALSAGLAYFRVYNLAR